MNNQSIVQQPKRNLKGKAIASLIIGIITNIFNIFALLSPMSGISVVNLFSVFFLALVGVVLGVGGLQSTNKNLAITGIILCIIALILFFKAPSLVSGVWY